MQFCTDATFSKVPLVLNEGDELGQWELEKVNDLLAVQERVYSYLKGDEIDNKTRGFAAGNVEARPCWPARLAAAPLSQRRVGTLR